MSRRYHSFIDSGVCKCGAPFRYRRVKKPKIYCKPCRAKERRAAIKFHNTTYYWLHKEQRVSA